MKLLIIGGSGVVGSLVIPRLAETHQLRILDMRPPVDGTGEYVPGDVTAYEDVARAVESMDALVYMAMGSLNWNETSGIVSAFDVNVKGVHLALRAAQAAGITQAVYTSTMSIYQGIHQHRYFSDEDLTPDVTDIYGFTKMLGEEVCRNAARLWGMNINALRLCLPTAEDKWQQETILGTPTIATTAGDVARAMDAALAFRAGFQAFMISGDYEQKIMNMGKAKRLLNWEPLARPTRQPETNEQEQQ